MAEYGSMETIKVQGAELANLVKQLIHEGNVRRIIVKQGGETIVEMPLTVGVAGAALSPAFAIASVLAALLTDCDIDIERTDAPADAQAAASAAGDGVAVGRPVAAGA
jgi:malate/lactate dehydrogenase